MGTRGRATLLGHLLLEDNAGLAGSGWTPALGLPMLGTARPAGLRVGEPGTFLQDSDGPRPGGLNAPGVFTVVRSLSYPEPLRQAPRGPSLPRPLLPTQLLCLLERGQHEPRCRTDLGANSGPAHPLCDWLKPPPHPRSLWVSAPPLQMRFSLTSRCGAGGPA